MREFQFNNQSIEMQIGGNTFAVNPAEGNFMKKLAEVKKKAEEHLKKTKTIGEKDNILKAFSDATTFLKGSIDDLLGEGSSDLIFKDRKENLLDMLDILAYISETITEETHNRTVGSYVNRAQKRAAAKAGR